MRQPSYRPSSRRSWGRGRPDNRRTAWRGAPQSRSGCGAPSRGTLEGLGKSREGVRPRVLGAGRDGEGTRRRAVSWDPVTATSPGYEAITGPAGAGEGPGPQGDPHPRRPGCSASASGPPGSAPRRCSGPRPAPVLCPPGREPNGPSAGVARSPVPPTDRVTVGRPLHLTAPQPPRLEPGGSDSASRTRSFQKPVPVGGLTRARTWKGLPHCSPAASPRFTPRAQLSPDRAAQKSSWRMKEGGRGGPRPQGSHPDTG